MLNKMARKISNVKSTLDDDFRYSIVGYPIVLLAIGIGMYTTLTHLDSVIGMTLYIEFLVTVFMAGLIPLVTSYVLIKAGL